MEGRTQLVCADCGRTREISGEMPEDYTVCFDRFVHEEGWVPRPGGAQLAMICGDCAEDYEGSETKDDRKIGR